MGGKDIDLTSKWRFSCQVQANRMTTVVQITYNFNQGEWTGIHHNIHLLHTGCRPGKSTMLTNAHHLKRFQWVHKHKKWTFLQSVLQTRNRWANYDHLCSQILCTKFSYFHFSFRCLDHISIPASNLTQEIKG